MLPEGNIRYWPRKLVPFALEAGWAIHPESKTGDWAVIMYRGASPEIAQRDRQTEAA